jgi:hypothetical protein
MNERNQEKELKIKNKETREYPGRLQKGHENQEPTSLTVHL